MSYSIEQVIRSILDEPLAEHNAEAAGALLSLHVLSPSVLPSLTDAHVRGLVGIYQHWNASTAALSTFTSLIRPRLLIIAASPQAGVAPSSLLDHFFSVAELTCKYLSSKHGNDDFGAVTSDGVDAAAQLQPAVLAGMAANVFTAVFLCQASAGAPRSILDGVAGLVRAALGRLAAVSPRAAVDAGAAVVGAAMRPEIITLGIPTEVDALLAWLTNAPAPGPGTGGPPGLLTSAVFNVHSLLPTDVSAELAADTLRSLVHAVCSPAQGAGVGPTAGLRTIAARHRALSLVHGLCAVYPRHAAGAALAFVVAELQDSVGADATVALPPLPGISPRQGLALYRAIAPLAAPPALRALVLVLRMRPKRSVYSTAVRSALFSIN